MRAISEKAFQDQVVQLARLCGWCCYHTHDSRRSQPGFPDLVLAKAGRPVIFAELKAQSGTTTPEQDRWLELLRSAPGVHVHLWRPDDLDTIAKLLQE